MSGLRGKQRIYPRARHRLRKHHDTECADVRDIKTSDDAFIVAFSIVRMLLPWSEA